MIGARTGIFFTPGSTVQAIPNHIPELLSTDYSDSVNAEGLLLTNTTSKTQELVVKGIYDIIQVTNYNEVSPNMCQFTTFTRIVYKDWRYDLD